MLSNHAFAQGNHSPLFLSQSARSNTGGGLGSVKELPTGGVDVEKMFQTQLVVNILAQHGGSGGQSASNSGHVGHSGLLGQNDGYLVDSRTGLNLLSSEKILAGHEAQLCKVLPLSRQFGITFPPPFFEEIAKVQAEIAASCAQ
jgi:hypothetical protein